MAGMRAGCWDSGPGSCSREGDAGRRASPRRYGTRRMAAPASSSTSSVRVGAGAAGLYAAVSAAGAGAQVALVSATPLADLGPRRARRGRRRSGPTCISPTRWSPAAGPSGLRPPERLCEEAPARLRDLERLGVRFDADRHGGLALGLEADTRRGASRRGARPGASASSPPWSRATAIEVLEARRATALLTVDDRCAGVACDDGRARPRHHPGGRRGRRGLWARTTNPPQARSEPDRCSPARRAPTSPTWSWSRPPPWPASPAWRAS